MTATTMTAIAIKTWKTNGVLLRNSQIQGHTVFSKHHQGVLWKHSCSGGPLFRMFMAKIKSVKMCWKVWSWSILSPTLYARTGQTAQFPAKCTVTSLQLNSFDIVGQISPRYVFSRHGLWPSWSWLWPMAIMVIVCSRHGFWPSSSNPSTAQQVLT